MSPTLNDGAGSEQRDIVLAEHYSRFHGKLKWLVKFVSWLTQSDQSDFSIGGVYFSYTPPRRCIFFTLGLDLLRIMGPWYKSVTSLGSMQVSPCLRRLF